MVIDLKQIVDNRIKSGKKIRKSDLAETIMTLKGKPYSLERYRMLRNIFDIPIDIFYERIIKAGRQVSKSTFNSKDLILDSVSIPFLNSLYVAPLKEQTTRFSNNYLGFDIEHTSIIRDNYISKDTVKNVLSRGFNNGSLIQLTYAIVDADRARGIPSDKVVYDEVQDILVDVVYVINECLSASEYKWINYTGTPKTIDNTLEGLWLDSTQFEWSIPCSHCKSINIPDEEHIYKMIGLKTIICHKCKSSLNTMEGKWVARNIDARECTVAGFHIPQIILPMHCESPKAWNLLLEKRIKYPPATFANECLGLSYDIGGRLVSLEELKRCSTGKLYEHYEDSMGIPCIVAGIDWGISAVTSHTVLVIGGILPGNEPIFRVVYAKKYYTMDILDQISDIIEICKKFKVRIIGSDVGVGATNNQILKRAFGDDKIYPFNYATAKRILNYNNNSACFILDKTSSLNLLFMALKTKHIQLLPQDFMIENRFYDDILAVHEELIDTPRGIHKVFNKQSKKITDDFLHALNFAVMTGYKIIDHPVTKMLTNYNLEELDELDNRLLSYTPWSPSF